MAKGKKGKAAVEEAPAEVESFEEDLDELDEDEDLEDDEDADEDEDDDLEEIEDDEEEEKPAKGKGKKTAKKTAAAPKREKIEFGSTWLAEHVSEATGVAVDARTLRILLRKLTKDEVIGQGRDDRSRYSWTGPKDAEVVAVVKAVKGGALEKTKSDGLAAARAAKDAKKKAREAEAAAEAAKPAKKSSKKAKAAEAAAPAKKGKSSKK